MRHPFPEVPQIPDPAYRYFDNPFDEQQLHDMLHEHASAAGPQEHAEVERVLRAWLDKSYDAPIWSRASASASQGEVVWMHGRQVWERPVREYHKRERDSLPFALVRELRMDPERAGEDGYGALIADWMNSCMGWHPERDYDQLS